jgi:hypothetical protein
MNLLQVQNALKNASDEQLVQMMKSPDSSAPSYLVLSELKRRKDMRAQQPEEPQGTIAEDLTKENTYDDQGIRALKTPGYEAEEQAAEQDGAGIEAMRAGGVVRMSDGGRPRIEDFYTGRPFTEMSDSDLAAFVAAQPPAVLARPNQPLITRSARMSIPSTALDANPVPTNLTETQRDALASEARLELARRQPSSRSTTGMEPDQGMTEAEMLLTPQRPAASPSVATPPAAPSAPQGGEVRPIVEPAASPSAAPPTRPAAAAGSPTAAGAGIGAVAAGGGGGGGGGGGINIREIMERNASLFPDTTADIRKQLSEMKTDPKARREEALNMALVEAGLRIASSNNPRLAGAIGEGATPALQSYNQQAAQIRQDQRADIKDQLAIAQADLQRQFANGQISGAELRARTQLLVAQMQEGGANARSAATLAARDRPEVGPVMASARARIIDLDKQIAEVRSTMPERETGSWWNRTQNPRYVEAEQRLNALLAERRQIRAEEQRLQESISGRVSARSGTASTSQQDPLGLR